MVTRVYLCKNCNDTFTARQAVTEPIGARCPACLVLSVDIILDYPPNVFVRPEATTVGQIAERNTKKMGKYKVEESEHKNKERLRRHGISKDL